MSDGWFLVKQFYQALQCFTRCHHIEAEFPRPMFEATVDCKGVGFAFLTVKMHSLVPDHLVVIFRHPYCTPKYNLSFACVS